MEIQNEWVSLNDDGTVWAYCGPGQNNVLGLVFKVGILYWKYVTKDECYSEFSVKTAARKALDLL